MIKKACQDINEDPETSSQLRQYATAFMSWYTNYLELPSERKAVEVQEKETNKTRKAKARRNLDMKKKKGSGLTPKEIALQAKPLG